MSSRLREFARAVELLANIAELDHPQLFPAVVLPGLTGIVPCDVVIYHEIDLRTASVQWSAYPTDALDPSRLPLYEHQIAMTLLDPARTVVGIALNRSRRGFTDHERGIVDLLRRPLAASFAQLRRRMSAATVPGGVDACGLTRREQQVLELVAAGRTDAAIGHLLGCSPRTVGKHLEHAYRKLGVSSRAAAVAGAVAAAPPA